MAYRIERTSTYRLARQDLGHLARLALRFAEMRISDGPPEGWVRSALTTRPMWMVENGDLVIWFTESPDLLAFELVVDMASLPDWFREPSGTWFETFLAE